MNDCNPDSERPVLVTGASGFLGSHGVRGLLAAGHRVRGLARSDAGERQVTALGAEPVRGDMTDRDSLIAAATGCRAIVHCAALVSDWDDASRFHDVNVQGMRNILDAAISAGVDRFVEVSSVGVYGMSHHHGTDETAPLTRSGDPYADSKVAAEELAFEYHRSHGLPLVVLRPGVIYGPGDRIFLPKLLEVLRNGRFCYVDHGHNQQTLVYVEDVASVFHAALTRPEAVGNAYNLTDPAQPTTREFVEMLAQLADLPAPTKSLPAPLAWGFCYLMEAWYRVFRPTATPMVNRTSMRFIALSRVFDVSRARDHLDYAPDHDLERKLRLSLAPGQAS